MNKPKETKNETKKYKCMEEMDRDILTERHGKVIAAQIMIEAKITYKFFTETENSIRDS